MSQQGPNDAVMTLVELIISLNDQVRALSAANQAAKKENDELKAKLKKRESKAEKAAEPKPAETVA